MELSGIVLMALIIGLALLVLLFVHFIPVGLWITAFFSGVPVNLFTLIGMRLRKVNPHEVIRPLISGTKAGLELEIDKLEAHHLAGGNVLQVTTALISADKANIELSFQQAAAIDLAGRDVHEAVKVSVNRNPKSGGGGQRWDSDHRHGSGDGAGQYQTLGRRGG
jgi:uncharacterized protein YqfA (UPF0365 family)